MEGQIGGRRSGEVLRARDRQTRRTVAYKRVTRASLTTPAVVERSQRELKQLQRAQSPRRGQILDFGKEPDGQLFVVTELAEGQTLARWSPRPDRSRSIAPRRSPPRSARRCSRGRRSASCTTIWPPKNVLVAAGDT